MLLSSAINYIQRQVKEALGLTKSPEQAKSDAIKKMLTDAGLTEPYNQKHCKQIASDIVDVIRKEQSSIVVSNDEETSKITDTDAGCDETSTDVDTISAYENDDTPASTHTDTVESSLTFTNNFEKAALIKSELSLSSIVVSDVQAIELTNSVADFYPTKKEFTISVHKSWLEYQKSQNDEIEDIVINFAGEMATVNVMHENRVKSIYMATHENIVNSQKRMRDDLNNFINSVTGK